MIEEKLRSLYDLQKVDSQIDEIRILRGELPMEVRDLEDDIAGLETRIKKMEKDLKEVDNQIAKYRVGIKDAETLIARYEQQQQNVKNNREFEALGKEIEVQKLEIQLGNKRIKEVKSSIESKQESIETAKSQLSVKQAELATKKDELKEIIAKTEKDEHDLTQKSDIARKRVEDRLLIAYDRLRSAYRNGLAVAMVAREACGGCFNQIPPQRQLEIRQHKKIIACEHCGRVLIDEELIFGNGE